VKIIFLPQGTIPVHADILKERPLGGTETGIVLLAEALSKLGHDVRVITDYENPPLSKPLYLPRRALNNSIDCDILICIRSWQAGFNTIQAKKRFFWTGDAYDQPATIGLGDKRVISLYDSMLCVSSWQAETLSSTSGFPKKKCLVIGNGINSALYENSVKKNPHRLVYTSTPYRGFQHLLRLFPEIKKQVQEASLHVFSDYDVYKNADGSMPFGHEANIQQLELLKKNYREQPGIVFRGNLKQHELAEELLIASILTYPNTFMETSCISALEAMAAGCSVVTSKRAALSETVGNLGYLISGEPGDKKYDQAFINQIVTLLQDPAAAEVTACKARKYALEQSWDTVAQRLLKNIL